MASMAVHFSKASDEWATPEDFFTFLHSRNGYTLDAAATRGNKLCPAYFGPDHDSTFCRDALAADWGFFFDPSRVWCNPPYSLCSQFVAKARAEVEAGRASKVDLLIPSRTDTRYWHDHIMTHASAIGFVKGRLKFGGAANGAPFPSVIVRFAQRLNKYAQPALWTLAKTPDGWQIL